MHVNIDNCVRLSLIEIVTMITNEMYFHFHDELNSSSSWLTCLSFFDEIDIWMSVNDNQLKLNADKTQFICLVTNQQFVKVNYQSLNLNGDDIHDITCLLAFINSEMNFCQAHLMFVRLIR